MIAIIDTRRQQAIKRNDRNKTASDDSGDSTDDTTDEEVRKGQEVLTDDGRDLQQTLSDMSAIDMTENEKTDRETAGAISTHTHTHARTHARTHAHTHTRLTALFPGLPR